MRRFPILAFLALAFALAAPGRADEPVDLEVMTYNIHHAEGTDGKVDLGRIRDLARGCDVVALNEVDWRKSRTGFRRQSLVVARELGMRHAFGETRTQWRFFKEGNAILSRHPIVYVKNHPLPRSSRDRFPRAVLRATIRVGDRYVHVFATHLAHDSRTDRLMQIAALLKLVRETRGPTIVLGDFNETPTSLEMARVAQGGLADAFALGGRSTGASFPAWAPDRRIDYVLFRGGLDPRAAWVVETRLTSGAHPSDHRPVRARLRLRGSR